MKLPKVLILCENSPSSLSGGGVLLNNLFYNFPPENLFFLHRDFNKQNDSKNYNNYPLIWIYIRINIKEFLQSLYKLISLLFKRSVRAKLSDFSAVLLCSSKFHIPSNIDKQIKQFQPEIIYAWTASSLWANTLKTIAKRYNLPYVIHFMDNHVDVKPVTTSEILLLSSFSKTLDSMVLNAAAIISISDAMSMAFKKKWGIDSAVFHGSIDLTRWATYSDYREPNEEFTLLYNGSIDRGQLLGLLDVAEAVEFLLSKGIQIKLIIHVSERYINVVTSSLARFRCVRFKLQTSFLDLQKTLFAADLLIMAYGFDARTISYFKYSFATKVVPYMLSGQCILAYGPKEIEPINYIVRGQFGVTVTESNIDLLSSVIEDLLNNPEQRRILASRARLAAIKEHDLQVTSLRFAKYLNKLSIKSKNN